MQNHLGKEQGAEVGEKRLLLAEAAAETSRGDLWGQLCNTSLTVTAPA